MTHCDKRMELICPLYGVEEYRRGQCLFPVPDSVSVSVCFHRFKSSICHSLSVLVCVCCKNTECTVFAEAFLLTFEKWKPSLILCWILEGIIHDFRWYNIFGLYGNSTGPKSPIGRNFFHSLSFYLYFILHRLY